MILTLFTICFIYSCGAPKNFTYYYDNKSTGLDQLIDINGYYISEYGCDSSFYSIYMFYANGLFSIATASVIDNELVDCFVNGGNSNLCKYPLWGTYQLEGTLIKTQAIRAEGNGCVIFRDYQILPDKSIVNIRDYVQPEYTNLGYMENYPSFSNNPCEKKAIFFSTEVKRDSTECPFLHKKWFHK